MPDKDLGPKYPSRLPAVVLGLRFLECLFIYWLDIGMMIISILAYNGAQSDDSREILKRTLITFPPVGYHIQRTEIALVSPHLPPLIYPAMPSELHY